MSIVNCMSIFPSWPQWSQLPKILNNTEKKLINIFLVLIIASGGYLSYNLYTNATTAEPADGGQYFEGAIGQPQLINPIISETLIDRDLTALIFSSLFKYDSEGNIIPDLAERYEIKNNGRQYIIYLKKNIRWHDQSQFNADDALFTIEAIKTSDYKSRLSPLLSNALVEKIDDYTLIFSLENPNYLFLNNLTFGIIPKSLENINPKNFSLSEFNLKPIGTGPYQFKNLKKEKNGRIISYTLERFNSYYGKKPHLDEITFVFFNNLEEIQRALFKNQINGVSNINFADTEKFNRPENIIYRLNIPRYDAIFFNTTKNQILSDKKIRLALSKAINKQELIKEILNNEGTIASQAILSFILKQQPINDYNPEEANKLLEESGFKLENNNRIKTTQNEKGTILKTNLEISITTLDTPEKIKTAELIKNQWGKIGVQTKITSFSINDLTQKIKDKDYEAILFAEMTGLNPELSIFWHSNYKNYQNLNLSLYSNPEIDQLLNNVMNEPLEEKRKEYYIKINELIKNDNPAIFLYSPYYLFAISKNIKGLNIKISNMPQERFNQISDWYINERRVWK